MIPVLRPYQVDAAFDMLTYIQDNPGKRPLVVFPTGAGKSYTIARVAELLCSAYAQGDEPTVLVVSHNKEIVEQDVAALETLLGEEVGVYSNGLSKRTRRRITVGTIGSVYKKPHLFSTVKFIIVDEAHLIPPEGTGQYRTLFDALPQATVAGFTATPFRLGTGYLHTGDNKIFDAIVHEVDIVELIKKGYLSKLHTQGSDNEFDVKGIKKVAGEFSASQLEGMEDLYIKTEAALQEMLPYKASRKKWLLFAISIEHCEFIERRLVELGIRAASVHSKIPATDRTERFFAHRSGNLQALVNVAVATTGYDNPAIDLVALLRPTASPVLHVQMIGRGLRVADGKENCLVLDFAGNIERLGPINDVHVAEKKKGERGEPPVKKCPQCKTHNIAASRKCYVCGYEFPVVRGKNVTHEASKKAVIKQQLEPQWYDVTEVTYNLHAGAKGLSLRVDYRCNFRTITEYLAFGRSGFAQANAEHWWEWRTKFKSHPQYYTPQEPHDAVKRANNGELREPVRILVDENGKYPNIKRSIFPGG